jgi:hypothetical protein
MNADIESPNESRNDSSQEIFTMEAMNTNKNLLIPQLCLEDLADQSVELPGQIKSPQTEKPPEISEHKRGNSLS